MQYLLLLTVSQPCERRIDSKGKKTSFRHESRQSGNLIPDVLGSQDRYNPAKGKSTALAQLE